MRIAILKVTPKVQSTALNANDVDVEGEYQITLNESVEGTKIVDVALDVFHSNIPVKVIDDFSYTVFFEDNVITPNPEHDAFSLSHLGAM